MYICFALVLAVLIAAPLPVKAAEAVFAGGCFWCMEHPFDTLDGVRNVQSGYAGGTAETANYKDVSHGRSDHKEVVQVSYDPAVIDYETLLSVFWRNVDPFDAAGQFCDKGAQYQSAIYTASDEENALAEQSKADVVKRFDREVATQILPSAVFYPAEDYHQDYYIKNPWRYKYYRKGCGRDKILKNIWGD